MVIRRGIASPPPQLYDLHVLCQTTLFPATPCSFSPLSSMIGMPAMLSFFVPHKPHLLGCLPIVRVQLRRIRPPTHNMHQVDYDVQRDVIEMTVGITATRTCNSGWLPVAEQRTTCRWFLRCCCWPCNCAERRGQDKISYRVASNKNRMSVYWKRE